MRTQHVRRQLPNFRRSYALLSPLDNVSRAVFFVNGFGGNVEDTFWAFQYFCDSPQSSEWWQSADLYFFDYRSVSDLISSSAQRWTRFLNRYFPEPPARLFRIPAVQVPFEIEEEFLQIGTGERTYTEAVLVGHSEGCVVIRHELVERSRNGNRWKDNNALQSDPVLHSKLKLFAPAHLGACPTRFWALLCNAFPTVTNIFLDWSPAATELRKSRILDNIKQETETLAARTNLPAFSGDVVFGTYEAIVSVGRFSCDNLLGNLESQTHFSVCKPRTGFTFPLDFVEGTMVMTNAVGH